MYRCMITISRQLGGPRDRQAGRHNLGYLPVRSWERGGVALHLFLNLRDTLVRGQRARGQLLNLDPGSWILGRQAYTFSWARKQVG